MPDKYDVIVVGGGHAGCEAAAAAAKLGSSVLLVTMDMNKIAQMSCNPAMGGIAKGQIVREIDAMGGMSGVVADKSMVQYRMLNRSKGPAMWSPRTQNDRMRFAEYWRLTLEQIENVDFWQEMGKELIFDEDRVVGVKTQLGIPFYANSVVLTNGTFLNGLIHIGDVNFGGGRAGEKAVTGLSKQLLDRGFETGRMKTGTPPRIDGRSIDYSQMEEQPGDEVPGKFSFSSETEPPKRQLSCYITYTNPEVHKTLEEGFDRSPMFNGRIQSVGPRYCPSIEDKIDRFKDKESHQLFVEPEGWDTVEVYVNGFSTSLPHDIQESAIRKVAGLENAKLFRPGYAIEYDYFQPHQLKHSLETKPVENLFFAGQINGTTGYEEAGCQGLMAGINAHRKGKNLSPVVLKRSDGYIGVLIDDLINKGTNEPYRMFTSRAEYRMLLRQDNADLRLTPLAFQIGLASEEQYKRVQEKEEAIQQIQDFLKKENAPETELNATLEAVGSQPVKQKHKLEKILSRPEVTVETLRENVPKADSFFGQFDAEILEEAEVQMKYGGFIDKEREMVEKMNRLEDIPIHQNINYDDIKALSTEGREKLNQVLPETIGQASRISGVSPSDISVLLVYLGR
jgi:tRNA uridine 5-carboxymethylaminomethyl modification enzyme